MFIFFVIIVILLFIGIPLGMTYLLYRLFKKRGFNKWVQILALTPTLVSAYIIYDFIYPSDHFYEQDFIEVTGLNFPDDGVIIHKSTSLPDHFGDYSSKFFVQVNNSFYSELPAKLVARGFKQDQQTTYSKWIQDYFDNKQISDAYYYEEPGGVYYFVGFIHDTNLLYIRRSSY